MLASIVDALGGRCRIDHCYSTEVLTNKTYTTSSSSGRISVINTIRFTICMALINAQTRTMWATSFLILCSGSPTGALGSEVGPADVFVDTRPWQEDNGKTLVLRDLLGQDLVAVTMAYANCERTCPMTFRLLRDFESRLSIAHRRLTVAVVSLDPLRDTEAKLKGAAAAATGHDQSWLFLRGTSDQTKAVAASLGVDPFMLDDHLVHKLKIWIYDGKGHELGSFDWQHRDFDEFIGKLKPKD